METVVVVLHIADIKATVRSLRAQRGALGGAGGVQRPPLLALLLNPSRRTEYKKEGRWQTRCRTLIFRHFLIAHYKDT